MAKKVLTDIDITGALDVSGTSGLAAATFTGNIYGAARLAIGTTIDTYYSGKFNGYIGHLGSYNTSDYRLKENVELWDTSTATSIVERLPVYSYNWNDKQEALAAQTQDRVGFLAHEASEMELNNCVLGEKDGEEYQTIDMAQMVPILWAALQDALKRIEVLEGSE